MMKMYEVAIDRKTKNGVNDFLDWLSTHLDYPEEVEYTHSTIGRFALKYSGVDDGKVHALFVEDEDGWCVEYFVYKNSDILTHEKIAR